MRTIKMLSTGYRVVFCVVLCLSQGALGEDSVEYETEHTVLDDYGVQPGDAKSAPVNLYPAPHCRLDASFKNYCHHRGPGLYSYTVDYNCFIQCDEWGKTYIKPCAYGTFWKPDGYEPTLYNRCVGRKPVVHRPPAYRNVQTKHTRQTTHYQNPATGQHVTHTQGQRVTHYARNAQPSPTNIPKPAAPLHVNHLVNMYMDGNPSLNRYVGRSGKSGSPQVAPAPQVHNRASQPQQQMVPQPRPQMVPRPSPQVMMPQTQQVQPKPHMLPQTQIYMSPVSQIQPVQIQTAPPQPIAQKLQLPQLPIQNQGQSIKTPSGIQITPIKISLPPAPSASGNRLQQAPQQGRPQQQRITLNSRFPLVASKGQGQLNLPKVNTNGFRTNGAPSALKQFNLRKQQQLARNFQLPGLKNKGNVIPTRKAPGFVKRNLKLQSQRAQNNGVIRPTMRRGPGGRRLRGGNQKGLANAKLMAERKRRLQQWRQFVKNGGQNRGNMRGRPQRRLNGRGGGDGRVTTAILHDRRADGKQSSEHEDINMAPEDDGFIDLDTLFGSTDDKKEDEDEEDEYDVVEESPLYDDTGIEEEEDENEIKEVPLFDDTGLKEEGPEEATLDVESESGDEGSDLKNTVIDFNNSVDIVLGNEANLPK